MPQEGYSATIKGAASAKQAGIARDRGEAHFDRLRILAIAAGLFSEIRLDIPRAGVVDPMSPFYPDRPETFRPWVRLQVLLIEGAIVLDCVHHHSIVTCSLFVRILPLHCDSRAQV